MFFTTIAYIAHRQILSPACHQKFGKLLFNCRYNSGISSNNNLTQNCDIQYRSPKKPLEFYYMPISPFCRSVQLTAHSIGVELNLHLVNLFKKEQNMPKFLALNPQHTVPTLIDDDLVLWESRAICQYLVNAYGKDDKLYPKEPKARVLVDRMLYFEIGTLGARFSSMLFASMADESYLPKESEIDTFYEALGFLEMFLKDQTWVAGSELTIADIVLVSLISSFVKGGLSLVKYPIILKWYNQCEEVIPGFKLLNEKGARQAGAFYKQMIPNVLF